jgi:acetyl-CoA C-acetyltransferase/acetyl-CoA acyltransferase
MTPRIAILDGVRTPFCKAGGALKDVAADDLGALVVGELLARGSIDPTAIDEVVFGNVAQPTESANVARVIALKAGIPQNVIAHTVHRNCASGMQSITAAALEILAGRAETIVVGGTESMSHIPLIYGRKMTALFVQLMRARTVRQRARALARFRPSFLKPVVALQLGLTDPICELNMGETAEILARRFGISREEQDAWACESHHRAAAAARQGRLGEEIIPVIAAPAYAVCDADDGPRPGQTMEALAKLRPYFNRQAGTVTVGNSCPITDGAVALMLTSEKKAKALGVEPLGYLTAWSYAALENECMGLGPAYATARLLEETGGSLDDFELIELNEAFAAQVIANERAFASDDFARDHLGRRRALGTIDRDRLNVNGGAIALGHPVGATGTRLVLTLLHELRRRGCQRGLATLCIGGGQGAALAVEAA